MQSKLLLSLAGLVIGIGLSVAPRTSQAFTPGLLPAVICFSLCNDLYEACVAERGPNAGCGRELRNCHRFCSTGTL